MARKYTYNASISGNMSVLVDCEACGRHYNYSDKFEAKSSQSLGGSKPSIDRENQLRAQHQTKVADKYASMVKERHQKGDYGFKACPQCGYMQSWMLKTARTQFANKIAAGIVVALIVLLAIFECRLALSVRGDGGLSTTSFIFAAVGVILILLSSYIVTNHMVHRYYEPNRNKVISDKVNEPNVVFKPSPADVAMALGFQALSNQQSGQGLAAFQKAVELDSGSAQAYMGRSLAHEASGNIEQASKDLRRYIAIAGSQADPKMVKHLDDLQFKHFAAVPSSSDPNEKSPPKLVGRDALLRFAGIAVAAAALLFVITQVVGFDRPILSLVIAVIGGGLLAAGVDTILAKQADTSVNMQSAYVSLGLIPLLVLTGMQFDSEAVGWDRFAGITSEVKTICESQLSSSSQASVSDLGKVWVHGKPDAADFDRDEAANLDDIDTLICVEESGEHIENCRYTNGGSITRYRREWTVIVIDFDTRNVVGRQTFTGDTPSACPQEISNSNDSDRYGSDPSTSEISSWLNTLER